MPEGIFHDARDIYCRSDASQDWTWIATFSSEALAVSYVASGVFLAGVLIELRTV